MPRIWIWQIEESPAGSRSDVVIFQALQSGAGVWQGNASPPSLSRTQVQRLLESDGAWVNGEPFRKKTRLQAGDEVRLTVADAKPAAAVAQDLPVEILFEDEHLAIVNKPKGISVHPSPAERDGTLVNALLYRIKKLSGVGGILRPGIVHRIDKDTSGVLVVSKSDEAHHRLAKTFAKHEIERRYLALCYGRPKAIKPFTIESLIGRNPKDRKKMSMTVKEGRRAVTHVKVLEAYHTASRQPMACLVEATLETGRTHQVRVHLAGIGCSILGDPTYGKPTENQKKWKDLAVGVREAVRGLRGQALHAQLLAFAHPITGAPLRFEAPPPADFQAVWDALKASQAKGARR
ncbi:MAG: RluA family pseudouridine synthase [Bacteriovoracia bacterium]